MSFNISKSILISPVKPSKYYENILIYCCFFVFDLLLSTNRFCVLFYSVFSPGNKGFKNRLAVLPDPFFINFCNSLMVSNQIPNLLFFLGPFGRLNVSTKLIIIVLPAKPKPISNNNKVWRDHAAKAIIFGFCLLCQNPKSVYRNLKVFPSDPNHILFVLPVFLQHLKCFFP